MRGEAENSLNAVLWVVGQKRVTRDAIDEAARAVIARLNVLPH